MAECPAVQTACTLPAITLIVRGSAKAQTMEESQQRSIFPVLPVILLVVGQFTGLMLIDAGILLALGDALAVAAWFFMRAFSGFGYETLLK